MKSLACYIHVFASPNSFPVDAVPSKVLGSTLCTVVDPLFLSHHHDIFCYVVQHHTGELSTTVPVPASSNTVLDGGSHNSKQQQAPYTITVS